jgi:hypothetical protein
LETGKNVDAEQVSSRLNSGISSHWPDVNCSHLVLETDGFVVFLDDKLDLDWQTSDEYDLKGPKDAVKHNKVLNRAAALESTPNEHHRYSVRLNFKRMVGEGVARSLDHDYDSAETVLKQALAYINDRNIEHARYWQLSTGCVLGLIMTIIGIVVWSLRSALIQSWGETGFYLVLAAFAGALGAALSMIFRMGKTYPTSEAPKDLHRLEAVSRIFAGCLSGVLVAGAVRIGLVLPVADQQGHLHATMLLAAMVSGASERLAPSLIGKLENVSIRAKNGETR